MEVEPTIDLHDSEIKESLKLLQELNQKYAYKSGAFHNLVSLQNEATERFREIGLEVTVDIFQDAPQITIWGRVEGAEFDPDRQRHEVQQGVADDFWEKKRQESKKKSSRIITPKEYQSKEE